MIANVRRGDRCEILRELAEGEGPSFVERWQGRFGPAEGDDARYRALMDKYR